MQERQKVTAEEFKSEIIRQLNDGNIHIKISHKEIKDVLRLTLNELNANRLLKAISIDFINCQFNDELIISGVLQIGFESAISFSDCKLDNTWIEKSKLKISITNSVLDKSLLIKEIVSSSIRFSNIIKYELIQLNDCTLDNLFVNNLRYIDNKFTSLFLYNNNIKNYYIDGVSVSDIIILGSDSCSQCHFSDVNSNLIQLIDVKILKELKFINMLVEGSINFWRVEYLNDFNYIQNDSLYFKDISNTSGYSRRLIFDDCKFGNVAIKGSHFYKLPDSKIIKKSKIIDIDFRFNSSSTGSITINNLNIQWLSLTGNNINSEFSILSSEIKTLDLRRFINKNSFNLTNVVFNTKSKIDFVYSYLGNSVFTNIDFSKISSFIIKHTQLSEIITNNITWPKTFGTDTFSNKKSVYRQLKAAMLSQNDKIQALEFEAKEMEAYGNELSESKGRFGEKIILQLSRTNDFGQNWGLAVCWLIGVAIVMHVLATCFVNFYSLEIYHIELWDKIEALAYYFNPIHTTKDLWAVYNSSTYPDYEVIADWFYFFDFAARLVTGFFYFQIVRAFRKYAR